MRRLNKSKTSCNGKKQKARKIIGQSQKTSFNAQKEWSKWKSAERRCAREFAEQVQSELQQELQPTEPHSQTPRTELQTEERQPQPEPIAAFGPQDSASNIEKDIGKAR